MKVNISHLVQYFAERGPVLLLESQSSDHPWSQKSYIAAQPEAAIYGRNDKIRIIEEGIETNKQENPWQELREFRKRHNNWLFGYLGYDLKNHLEDLKSDNADPVDAPDMYFMVPGFLLEIDHQTGDVELIRGTIPSGYKKSTRETDQPGLAINELECQTSRAQYLSIIRDVQDRIAEGDFYEINISHQLAMEFSGTPWTMYQQMKDVGTVPFGAFLQLDDLSICCQSPERFLRKEGKVVFSQPIKGTTQRGHNEREDETLKNDLLSSAKERAENLMIVDLVRNDLGRIARRGTVEVPELFSIQSFGTVHQMVSTVKAEAKETDPVRILEACFPMGSMTGAPKISAMKTIEEIEQYRRGVYSGAIGYITPDGDFDFNVVIRTALLKGSRLYYAVGGAITGDSDPEKEWQETLIKARALLDVDGVVNSPFMGKSSA